MSTNNGGQAFPRAAGDYNGSRHGNASQDGMTLRDYFAAKAIQGMLANNNIDGHVSDYANDAYRYADAMLAAREGK